MSLLSKEELGQLLGIPPDQAVTEEKDGEEGAEVENNALVQVDQETLDNFHKLFSKSKVCQICSLECSTHQNKRKHVEARHLKIKAKCPECPYAVKNSMYVQKHLVSAHHVASDEVANFQIQVVSKLDERKLKSVLEMRPTEPSPLDAKTADFFVLNLTPVAEEKLQNLYGQLKSTECGFCFEKLGRYQLRKGW